MSQFQRNDDLDIENVSQVISRLGENGLQKRISIIIKNNGTAAAKVLTLNLGRQKAVAGKGITLAQGETFADSSEEGYECYQGVITAICCEAGGSLSIMER